MKSQNPPKQSVHRLIGSTLLALFTAVSGLTAYAQGSSGPGNLQWSPTLQHGNPVEGPNSLNINSTGTVPKFDPTNGVLREIRVYATITLKADLTETNAEDSDLYYAEIAGSLTTWCKISSNGRDLAGTLRTYDRAAMLGYIPQVNFPQLNPGYSDPGPYVDEDFSEMTSYTDPSDLAEFTGTGTASVTAAFEISKARTLLSAYATPEAPYALPTAGVYNVEDYNFSFLFEYIFDPY